MSGRPAPLNVRFAQKYRVDESGCWLWTASKTTHGYGQINVAGYPRRAHRVSYELHVGPIPEGLQLDHLCRVRHCVNPEHLEPVTQLENIRRGVSSATQIRRTGQCIYGHDAAFRVSNGRWTRCGTCSNERRREAYSRRIDAVAAAERHHPRVES